MARIVPILDGVDEIWHAGDWQYPEILVSLAALGKPLLVVNGNAPDDPAYPDHVVRRIEDLTIGMVHRPPRGGEEWLAPCDLVIHGHTHRWRDEVVGGRRYVNVSTPTAAGLGRERTMGILTLERGRADLQRVDLSA